jgi:phospholipase D-like protein/putative oligomerization/nucleic acid binding protein
MHGYGSLTFFSILWFFLWVLWIFLLIRVIGDVFRSADLSGAGKAGWTLLLVIFPFAGVLLYLLFRGTDMHVREDQHAVASQAIFRHYLQQNATSASSAADEIAKLASLRDQGLLTEEEYAGEKACLLVSTSQHR